MVLTPKQQRIVEENAKAPTVRMWMTKARRYLKDYPELASYVGRQA